jgi:predicted exporter
MFGTLPAVRQLGLFVGAGVLSALFAAYCLRPVFPARLTVPRQWLLRSFALDWKPRTIFLVVALPLAGILVGAWRIEWHDDIRELDLASPGLMTADERVREISGTFRNRTVLLTSGESMLGAVDAWREFDRDWKLLEQAPLIGLGSFLPSTADLATTRSFMDEEKEDWIARLRRSMAERGYDTEAFADFFEAFDRLGIEEFTVETAENHLQSLLTALTGPVGILLPHGGGLFAVASITGTLSAETTAIFDQHRETVSASQLESLNGVFARYRLESWKLVLGGFLMIATSILLFYGIRRGLETLGISVFGVAVTFGLLGWFHRDLNLFHLLAGLLGFCLAVHHALFAVQARKNNLNTPASVRISALTTAVAFGVIATSRIPAVSALGWTVACVVAATTILIEFLGTIRINPNAPDRS